MTDFLSSMTIYETLFVIGMIGAFISLPLTDVISVGFYDITDFFLSLLSTSVIANAIGKDADTDAKTTLMITFLIVSLIIAFMKILVINPFMKSAENNTGSSLKDLEGVQGVVITSITKKGIGEIMVSNEFIRLNKMAKIYEDSNHSVESIENGEKVLIIEIRENIAYVIPYESDFKMPNKG